jgi:AbrB family looped-hinge helix DNA binding protein
VNQNVSMPTSTITSKGRTTLPKEVRDALDLEPGDSLSWEVRGNSVVITKERPALYRWKGSVKGGPGDAVAAVAAARKTRGRI